MKRIAILSMLFLLSLPAVASHGWADIDICETYQDKLPPGLTVQSLPESTSPGAQFLDHYCTQCHNLPAPDRHTASEWREVTSRMFMLMDVSNRFGGYMGKVENIQLEKQRILLEYLESHASSNGVPSSSSGTGVNEESWLRRTMAILPFLLLTGAGLLRWRRRFNKIRACTP